MTISLYRTADAWWAGTPDAVARIDTEATTTAQLLADRPAIQRRVERIGRDIAFHLGHPGTHVRIDREPKIPDPDHPRLQ